MANTSSAVDRSARRRYYFQRRFQNRVFAKLASFFVAEAKRAGVTKKDIAERLNKDPAQVTRWLSSPTNLTLDTISDLLFALDAEPQPFEIARFSEATRQNYCHPLMSKALHNVGMVRHLSVDAKSSGEFMVITLPWTEGSAEAKVKMAS